MQRKNPIGVFDSGYGGLTVLAEIIKKLPQYDYIYLGDNARAPYGPRSFDVVYEFTLEAVKELFSRGCELVVLACNTASAKALRTIQQKDLPQLAPHKRVLGVIRPSTEIIGQLSQTNHVGILATEGTVKSLSFPLELAKFSPETIVHQHACPMWVPLIENGRHLSEGGKFFIQEDIQKIMAKDSTIDVIILACTHFPILKDYIQTLVPKNVKIVAQGAIIAEKLEDYLVRHQELDKKCTKNGEVQFLTTENSEDFDKNASKFLGYAIKSEHVKLG
ncbi:MAG: glutamate racemase [Flavobacteriia bacterium]|nr:glutamate racemase [Flavobacteriia bacterium]